jgi:hypothetical protein
MCARAFRKNACDNAPSRWRVTYVFAICRAVVAELVTAIDALAHTSDVDGRDSAFGRRGHDEVGNYSKLWAGTGAGPGAAAGAAGGATVALTCEPSAGV